jgi:hypothetical protein
LPVDEIQFPNKLSSSIPSPARLSHLFWSDTPSSTQLLISPSLATLHSPTISSMPLNTPAKSTPAKKPEQTPPISLSRTHPSASGLTHIIQVTCGADLQIYPNSLDVPVGDIILFHALNKPFQLYTTGSRHPCAIKGKVDRVSEYVHQYRVNQTAPVWFLICPMSDSCHCGPASHFALNAGSQREQFFANASATSVVLTTTTIEPTPTITFTSVKVVTRRSVSSAK